FLFIPAYPISSVFPYTTLFRSQEVGEMAETLGVPDSVVRKRPSADLWAGQSDEEEMGTKYRYIDRYVSGEDVPEADKKTIEKLHNKTAHKRKMPTPFIFR